MEEGGNANDDDDGAIGMISTLNCFLRACVDDEDDDDEEVSFSSDDDSRLTIPISIQVYTVVVWVQVNDCLFW